MKHTSTTSPAEAKFSQAVTTWIAKQAELHQAAEQLEHEDSLSGIFRTSLETLRPAVIGYIRTATKAQPGSEDHHHGVQHQFDRLTTYARICHLDLRDIIVGHGESGTSADPTTRPSLETLYQQAEQSDEPVSVLVTDLSRIARTLDTHLDIERELAKHGWDIIALNDHSIEPEPTENEERS